jgi:hypothetical protein
MRAETQSYRDEVSAETHELSAEDILSARLRCFEPQPEEPLEELVLVAPAPARAKRPLRHALIAAGVGVTSLLVVLALVGARRVEPAKVKPTVQAAPLAVAPASPRQEVAQRPTLRREKRHARETADRPPPGAAAAIASVVESSAQPVASKAQRVRDQLKRARLDARKRDWRGAQRQAAAVLKVDPRNKQARLIKRKARDTLHRADRKVKTGQLAARKKNWRRARQQAVAALRLDPRNTKARALKKRADTKLRASAPAHRA